jgi:O-antigen biosynthesis protein WbqP
MSFLLIVFLQPLMVSLLLITSLTTKNKAIYRQQRLGKNEKAFSLYKFRTMKMDTPYAGTEKMTEEETKRNTTKWGSVMRKCSFDELPQLFNILKGDMSFIGPRPGLTDQGEPRLHQLRLSYLPSPYSVRPGLSGYSQIKSRRSPDIAERARCDSYYVQHVSFGLDLKIFLLSCLAPFGYASNKIKK